MENPLSLYLQNTIKTGRNLNFENETYRSSPEPIAQGDLLK